MQNDDDHNDPLGEALGLPPRKKPQVVELVPKDAPDEHDPDSDFVIARSNVLDLIDKGKVIFEEVSYLAEVSQDVKFYGAVARIFDNLLQANRDVVDLAMKRNVIRAERDRENGGRTINNNLFVGSTAEILDMLDKVKKDEGDGT